MPPGVGDQRIEYSVAKFSAPQDSRLGPSLDGAPGLRAARLLTQQQVAAAAQQAHAIGLEEWRRTWSCGGNELDLRILL